LKSNKTRNKDKVNFLIYQSCFWCASYLYGCYNVSETCHLCGNTSSNNNIESIPIAFHEAHEFEYNQLRGRSLNIFTSHKSISSTSDHI
jgi:hypothetical protein